MTGQPRPKERALIDIESPRQPNLSLTESHVMNAVVDLVMQEWEHIDEDLVNQSTASLQSLSLSAKQRIGEEMISSKLN
jgi:hypothetical protein